MTTKKLGALLMAAVLTVSLVPKVSAAEQNTEKGSASYELSDYIDGQVLALYKDGTTKVFTYDTLDALKNGINDLSAQSDVICVQPNFLYGSTGVEVDDPMYDEQWALSNDGTFVLEDSGNDYPVYDQPFGTPAAPGEWTNPGGGAMTGPGGMTRRSTTVQTAETTAVSGIDINAEEAWELYDGGSKVIVALIDTGVDNTHEDLADSIWANEDEIAGNGIDDDGNGYIDDAYGWNFYDDSNQIYVGSDDDHGTHGAGTMVAAADNGTGIAGIAGSTDNVEIMVLKALGGRDGSGSTEDVIEAIQYAEANGASIVNLSLGTTTFDYALYLTIKNSDLLFVVAAGNDGTDSDVTGTYPAAYDLHNIISVANLQPDGTLHSSSNYGAVSVDIAAPGTYILSATTEDTYSYMTGTSMATPMVTAVAALVYSYYDDISLSDVRQIILGSAAQLDTLDGVVSSGGMLDAGAALQYDLTALEETDPDSEDVTGTAPVITYETYSEDNTNYLQITVADAEDDFCLLCYETGEQTVDYFNYGSAGTQVNTDSEQAAVFRVVKGGTYTFYALDTAGNQTIQVLTVTAADGNGGSADNSDSDAGNQTQPGVPPDNFPGGGRPGARTGMPVGGFFQNADRSAWSSMSR